MATDVETKWLELLDEPNLEVRRADIAIDALGHEEFDLVHARMVLSHTDAARAMTNFSVALRPGGWLLVEDTDFCSAHLGYPPVEVWERFWGAMVSVMAGGGADAFVGRKLPFLVQAAGLVGDEPVVQTTRLTDDLYAATVGRAAPLLKAAGRLSDDDAAALAALPRGEQSLVFGPLTVRVWARYPATRTPQPHTDILLLLQRRLVIPLDDEPSIGAVDEGPRFGSIVPALVVSREGAWRRAGARFGWGDDVASTGRPGRVALMPVGRGQGGCPSASGRAA